MSERALASTCLDLAFISDGRFCALRVEQPDDLVFVSEMIEISLAVDGSIPKRESLLIFDGWLTCFALVSPERLLIGSADGDVFEWSPTAIGGESVGERGVTRIHVSGPKLAYCTSIDGQVRIWDGMAWTVLWEGSGNALSDVVLDPTGIVWACGEAGHLARIDPASGEVKKFDMGTNVTLNALACDQGGIFVAGNSGFAAFVSDGEATFLEGAKANLFRWSKWRGNLYVAASSDGVLRLDGRALVPTRPGPRPFGLTSGSRYLAAVDGDEVWLTEGGEWSVISLAASPSPPDTP
jgi:WD40 repeat protein